MNEERKNVPEHSDTKPLEADPHTSSSGMRRILSRPSTGLWFMVVLVSVITALGMVWYQLKN